MQNSVDYNLRFHANGAEVTAAVTRITQGITGIGNKADAVVGKLMRGMGRLNFNAVAQQINGVAQGFNDLAKPGLDLSTSMGDLQAMTGVAGEKLKEIEGYARANAKTFGGPASESMESYKLILSQLEPEIAKVPAALKAMGENVSVLSKSMGGDVVGATEVLTTAMNQYQVSTKDPIAASKEMARMMNVMQAAALAGAAELPDIKSALVEAGMGAKMAGVSFEETNTAIEVLAKSGKKGAEGGVAIRNMLAIMGEGRFIPKHTLKALEEAHINVTALGDKSKTFSERLSMLKPLLNDTALLSRMFGKENMNAAQALISQVDLLDDYKKQVTGTTAAIDSAAIVMEEPAEKAKRLQARIDDLKISMFNGTNGWLGYVSVLGTATRDFTNLWPAVTLVTTVLGFNTIAKALNAAATDIASGATTRWAVIQTAFNTTLWACPITWIVIAIIALIAVIAYVVYKTDGWGKMWSHTVNGAKLLWEGFTAHMKWMWDTTINGLMIGLDKIKKAWFEFKSAVGLGDDAENNKMIAAIDADTEKRKKEITDGAAKVQGLYVASAVEFKAAAGSLHWNNKDVKKDIAKEVGVPGATGTGAGASGSGGKGAAGAGTVGKKSNEAIATGGTKNTTVNVQIGNQIGSFTLSTLSMKEGLQQMRDMILDETTRALQMGISLGVA